MTVRDFGIGINEKDQRNLFKPFFKTSDPKSLELNSQGHGLGLAIAFKIANRLGGHLRCESKVGLGTSFTLEILSKLSE